MKKRIINISQLISAIVASIVIFTTCQEAYIPEDVDSSKKLLVVEGSITDNPGPYIVMLSYSSPFSDRYYYNFIRDAAVFISDDAGYSEKLTEKGNGRYYTSENGIRGTIGRTYTLRIQLSNGEIYESIPAKLNPVPAFDSIYPVIGTKDFAVTNGNGEVSMETDKGLYLRFSATCPEMTYYRLSSTVTTQTIHSKTPMGSESFDVYCWENSYLTSSIDVKSTAPSGSEYVIREHNMGFLKYVFDGSMPKYITGFTIGPKQQIGWDVITNVYSISPDAYRYYESVVKQLNAGARIFDPIPSQLLGNIKCITDSNKVVLGLFDVTSDSTVFNAFFWDPSLKNKILRVTADSIPLIMGNNCLERRTPSFWVDFFLK